MNQKIISGHRTGSVTVPASKSLFHRYMIALSLAGETIPVDKEKTADDVTATLDCLDGIRKKIQTANDRESHSPVQLFCGESGTTLRFLLPVAAALSITANFHLEEQLSRRPHDALIRSLAEHGAKITKSQCQLHLSGKLHAGDFTIPGDISSQFASGLLFALPLLGEESILTVTGKSGSRPYIQMTEEVLSDFGITLKKDGNQYHIPGGQHYIAPEKVEIEKDWSAAAFYLCMGAFSGKGILVRGLSTNSLQGDRVILKILRRFGAEISVSNTGIMVRKGTLKGQIIDAGEIPDLVPPLAVLAAGSEGTTQIINAGRLRYKESDRLKSTAAMLSALGADLEEKKDGLMIYGRKSLHGGCIDPAKDHRIAMAAAEAACICCKPVIIQDAECVRKSYPDFWDDFHHLTVIRE